MSSNAESAIPATTCKVGTRQLSADLSAAGTEHSARDLGAVTVTRFREILSDLAALPAEQVLDADPHLVVTARRGRFLVRPHRGKLRLFDANDGTRAHLELNAADASAYLDGVDIPDAAAVADCLTTSPEAVTNNARTGLVAGMLVFSVLSVAVSAYFTFRPTAIDSEVQYTELSSPAQVASLRDKFTGEFATGTGPGSRILTLRPEGTLSLVEAGPDNMIADKYDDTYQFALRDGQTPVARTATLGPIELRDPKTLFYAGEAYVRHP